MKFPQPRKPPLDNRWRLGLKWGDSLLAREINWLETGDGIGRKIDGGILYSLLAREINWLETLLLLMIMSGDGCSLLAREINWLETRTVGNHRISR